MTTPTIQFRDSIGAVTITATGLSLNNWLPDVAEINDRAVPMGTGLESFWRYRRDFTASFELPHIPASDLGNLHRLKSHLLSGGFITVSTNDAKSRVYTCSVKPGSTPEWTFSDRQQLEYTLALEVRNVMPYPMICDYSSYGGTTGNLLTNAGGETGSDAADASGWTDDTGDTLVIDTAQSYAGSKSLLHTNTSSLKASHSYQSITPTSGSRYALSGWIRLDAEADDTADINITASGGNAASVFQHRKGADTLSSGLTSAGSVIDWTFAALVFDATDTDALKAYLRLDSAGAANGWFDELRLEVVPKV